MNKQTYRSFLPAIILFIIINAAALLFSEKLANWGFDSAVIIPGNLILFIITFISFSMCVRAVHTKNNHAFFRLVYGSFLIKMFFLAAAAFIYIMIAKKEVNKPGLFFCMGLYLVYSFIEVSTLMKITKSKTNA